MPLVDRLRADLEVRVALVHSGLGGRRARRRVAADPGRRRRHRRRGRGSRSSPRSRDVGVVIVDEEHEAAYKSDRTPRLQARDTAIRLGELARAAVVLGSATPAVDSVGRARDGAYRRVVLPTRPTGEPPAVEVVDLREELRDGNRGLLSGRLAAALAALDRGPRRPGDPRHQPPRDGVGRPVPRLRPRPGLPGLRPAARLPPGRRHAPLPPLRPGVRRSRRAAPTATRRGSSTSAAARSESSARSGSASPGCGSAASIATSSSAAAPRSGSSTRSPRASSTSSSGRASSRRASTSRT